MSNKCPHCGGDINLTDPYRTAPPKEPEKAPKKEPKKRWYHNMDWTRFFDRLWNYTVNVFWYLVVTAIVSVGVYCLYKVISTPNKIDYCFVTPDERVSNSWSLIGHVNWSPNRSMGHFTSVDGAQKYAKVINCPLDLTPVEPQVNEAPSAGVASHTPPVASSAVVPAPSSSVPDLLP